MTATADFTIERAADGAVLVLKGDWTSLALGRVGGRLAQALAGAKATRLDLTELGRFDTAGAFELTRVAGVDLETAGVNARPDVQRLVNLVLDAAPTRRRTGRRFDPVYALLTRTGVGAHQVLKDIVGTFAFYGRLTATLGRVAVNPRRLRVAPTVSLMERAGLDAIPIVVATNFFVGATIAFLGANLLSQFGASVFTVELIGIGVLREFAVLITAVILAGRSASSFAAELGSMKMNQEIDAMQVMGVDPYEALVLPRFTAMLLMMPLLVFAAIAAGLFGGMVVTWAVLDLSPAFFLERMLNNVGPTHFWVGMSKSPVLALVIAAIGCRQGFEVGGDVEQLGRRVTTAVVQALFAIIVLDAIFALLFMQLDV
jgi:phospholipid/cholesterol/gamma-HCH transport system permease protein